MKKRVDRNTLVCYHGNVFAVRVQEKHHGEMIIVCG